MSNGYNFNKNKNLLNMFKKKNTNPQQNQSNPVNQFLNHPNQSGIQPPSNFQQQSLQHPSFQSQQASQQPQQYQFQNKNPNHFTKDIVNNGLPNTIPTNVNNNSAGIIGNNNFNQTFVQNPNQPVRQYQPVQNNLYIDNNKAFQQNQSTSINMTPFPINNTGSYNNSYNGTVPSGGYAQQNRPVQFSHQMQPVQQFRPVQQNQNPPAVHHDQSNNGLSNQGLSNQGLENHGLENHGLNNQRPNNQRTSNTNLGNNFSIGNIPANVNQTVQTQNNQVLNNRSLNNQAQSNHVSVNNSPSNQSQDNNIPGDIPTGNQAPINQTSSGNETSNQVRNEDVISISSRIDSDNSEYNGFSETESNAFDQFVESENRSELGDDISSRSGYNVSEKTRLNLEEFKRNGPVNYNVISKLKVKEKIPDDRISKRLQDQYRLLTPYIIKGNRVKEPFYKLMTLLEKGYTDSNSNDNKISINYFSTEIIEKDLIDAKVMKFMEVIRTFIGPSPGSPNSSYSLNNMVRLDGIKELGNTSGFGNSSLFYCMLTDGITISGKELISYSFNGTDSLDKDGNEQFYFRLNKSTDRPSFRNLLFNLSSGGKQYDEIGIELACFILENIHTLKARSIYVKQVENCVILDLYSLVMNIIHHYSLYGNYINYETLLIDREFPAFIMNHKLEEIAIDSKIGHSNDDKNFAYAFWLYESTYLKVPYKDESWFRMYGVRIKTQMTSNLDALASYSINRLNDIENILNIDSTVSYIEINEDVSNVKDDVEMSPDLKHYYNTLDPVDKGRLDKYLKYIVGLTGVSKCKLFYIYPLLYSSKTSTDYVSQLKALKGVSDRDALINVFGSIVPVYEDPGIKRNSKDGIGEDAIKTKLTVYGKMREAYEATISKNAKLLSDYEAFRIKNGLVRMVTDDNTRFELERLKELSDSYSLKMKADDERLKSYKTYLLDSNKKKMDEEKLVYNNEYYALKRKTYEDKQEQLRLDKLLYDITKGEVPIYDNMLRTIIRSRKDFKDVDYKQIIYNKLKRMRGEDYAKDYNYGLLTFDYTIQKILNNTKSYIDSIKPLIEESNNGIDLEEAVFSLVLENIKVLYKQANVRDPLSVSKLVYRTTGILIDLMGNKITMNETKENDKMDTEHDKNQDYELDIDGMVNDY